ncbi:MAG TPA: patatin-like phospholipase family protein [Vicinamibacterales bacterium]|nr:patatin-like phospholipase family protein [Vicinamibacterales bacterium]
MHPVIDILNARRARKSRAPHDDGARVALCVEGGAMRGVISAGMVSALEALGLTHAFDAVYGSSAGAINAAYFLAGQASLGTTIYYEDINNRRFIDLSRALVGRPIVNLSYLLDDVAATRKRLEAERVVASASPLTVLATDVRAQRSTALRGFRDRAQLIAALRASATMPVVAGPPVEYEGRAFLDASLSEPIPVPAAESDACTHALVLLTRTGGMRPQPSAFDRYFVGPRLRRLSPELADRYLKRAEPYSTLVRAIDAGAGLLGRMSVVGVRVPDLRISKLERRADVLREGARRGYTATMATFAS